MTFFIRLFSITKKRLSREVLLGAFAGTKLSKGLSIEEESTDTHNQFLIKKNKREIAIIVELFPKFKNADQLKLKEIIEKIKYKKPFNANKWLRKYLKKTEVIYEFLPLYELEKQEDWDIITEIYQEAWVFLRGIFQIKNEGFTNESGDIILWEFPFSAAGKRVMASRSFTGRWKTFIMDLESTAQRKKFFKGKVPKNVKIIFRG